MSQRIGILASSYFVPDTRLRRDELAGRFGAETVDKIAESSGILERRVARSGECASDLAQRAAEDLLTEHAIDRSSIDLLVFATQTPDYLLPTTACILQHKLRLPTACAAFDINLGCSQYIYALSVACSMLQAGVASRALVLTGDTVSRILNPKDRAVVPLFGDAGSATLLGPVAPNEGFLGFHLGSDGAGAEYLIWPTSGLREPRGDDSAREVTDNFGATRSRDDMYMDGRAIFLFTLQRVAEAVQAALAKQALRIDDIDLFVFHQASELIVESAAKKLKIPRHKLHYKLHDVGNSGGSTVAVCLTDAWLQGRIKPGMKVLLAAFGVGLSWAVTAMEWPSQTLGPVCKVDFTGSPARPPKQVPDDGPAK